MGIHYYLFSKTFFEISYVSESQKQAFSKRLKNMSAPPLRRVNRHPSVSLRVQRYYKKSTYANKKSGKFAHVEKKQ